MSQTRLIPSAPVSANFDSRLIFANQDRRCVTRASETRANKDDSRSQDAMSRTRLMSGPRFARAVGYLSPTTVIVYVLVSILIHSSELRKSPSSSQTVVILFGGCCQCWNSAVAIRPKLSKMGPRPDTLRMT